MARLAPLLLLPASTAAATGIAWACGGETAARPTRHGHTNPGHWHSSDTVCVDLKQCANHADKKKLPLFFSRSRIRASRQTTKFTTLFWRSRATTLTPQRRLSAPPPCTTCKLSGAICFARFRHRVTVIPQHLFPDPAPALSVSFSLSPLASSAPCLAPLPRACSPADRHVVSFFSSARLRACDALLVVLQ